MLHFKGFENSSSLIKEGYAYWESKCNGEQIPSWSDINPSEIKSLLPNVVIIHVSHDPLDFVERITGDAILSRSTQNSMGKSWREYEGRGPDSQIWKVMEEVIIQEQPSFHSIPYVGPHQEFMKVDTVACPLKGKNDEITRLLVFVDYLPTDDSEDISKFLVPESTKRFTI